MKKEKIEVRKCIQCEKYQLMKEMDKVQIQRTYSTDGWKKSYSDVIDWMCKECIKI